jgi:uronate dehydrogenase
MVEASLTAPAPGFAVLYGISANTRAWWDLEPGRALGYEPRDDAEEHAARIEATPATEQDAVEAAHVGGPFVTERFYRPALGEPPASSTRG